MILSIIVAYDRNRVIGFQNKIPWHLSEDLRRFKKLTTDHIIIMGRKTFESIGRELPNRINRVVSRKSTSLNDEIERAKSAAHDEVFVIGGAEIFKQALPLADRIYLTEIDAEFEGDTFFPAIDFKKEFRIVEQSELLTSASGDLRYRFITAERRNI